MFKKVEGENEQVVVEESDDKEDKEENQVNNNEEKQEDEQSMSSSTYNNTVILLDNGHAKSTPGKRSPLFEDGKTRFYEYEFNRDIVRRISEKLEDLGIKYHIITPELEQDITLSERGNRVNKYCGLYGAGKCLLISVHANAAGNGSAWMNGRGWEVWTTKGTTKSDAIATIFFNEAKSLLPKYGMTLRSDMSDGDPDYEANFTLIYKAKCPAILTENLFMDNKKDVEFLMSEKGRDIISEIHVNAIKKVCGLE